MPIENVTIIIPTYNESAVIEETIIEVSKFIADVPEKHINILIFDSASTDNTQALVRGLQHQYPHLHLRSELKKSGLGSAYMQAMKIALNELSADVVFEFDADLSHQPCYILPMLERLKTSDVVVGSRYVKGGSIPKDWGKLFSVVGNWIARAVLTPRYKDFTSGFRATRRHALQKALPSVFLSNQYAYKLQLLWCLHQTKAHICELPIAFIDRTKGESKLPTNSVLDSLRVIFTLRYYELKRYLKMCVVGLSGATVQFVIYNALSQITSPFHAAQLAVSVAILNNYILNNYFTFKDREETNIRDKLKTLCLFLVYSVLIIQLQSYWIDFGVTIFGRGPFKENLMVLLGMGIGSILNYVIYSRLVWRQPQPRSSKA